jgi:MATE family multidrug resistance protein
MYLPLSKQLRTEIRREAIAILQLGAPLIAAQLAQVSINVVDTVIAGNFSADALAAVAVGSNVWFLAVVVCMGLLMSVSPSVAQLYGGGRLHEIGPCVRQGLWLALGAASLGMLAFLAAEPLFKWLRVVPEIVPTAIGFLRAISWGLPAMCLFQVLRSFSEAVSMTRPVMYMSAVGLAVCAAGDYILMYGKFGLPALGAVGCGVASAVALWLTAILMILYVRFNPAYRKYGVFDRFDWPDMRRIAGLLRVGAPIAFSIFMEVSLFGAVALLMGQFGATVVGGHQIAINLASVTFMVPFGLAMAVTVRVGQAIGRGDPRGARFSGNVGVMLAAVFMTCSAMTLISFPDAIAGIYTADAEVRKIAATLLTMAGIFQIFDGLQVAGAGALRGLKDTRIPMFITAFAYWGIGMPLGYGLGFAWSLGPPGLWTGFIFGLAVAAVLLNRRFRRVTERLMQDQSPGRAETLSASAPRKLAPHEE